jgi:hypothetical protein
VVTEVEVGDGEPVLSAPTRHIVADRIGGLPFCRRVVNNIAVEQGSACADLSAAGARP